MPFVLLGAGGLALGFDRALGGEPVTIGRDSSNTLSPEDPLLSRRHCVLEARGGEWILRDLGSSNGTFVHGDRVAERRLVHEDEIRAGSCRFLFLDDTLVSGGLRLMENSAAGCATETMRVDMGTCGPLAPASIPRRGGGRDPGGKGLAALLGLAASVPAATDFGAARKQFLEAVFQTVPAARAVLSVFDPTTGVPGPTAGWSREAGPAPPFPLPEPFLAKALEQGAALSLAIENGQRTLQVIPLVCDAGACGFLALESPSGGGAVEPGHLEWLCAAARLAAGPLMNLARMERLRRENRILSDELNSSGVILGETPAILALKAQILKAAPSDATVLITGETGAGKEPAARAIHAASRRAKGPFVAVNCATLSPTLLESDLFGHERGAFTGAVSLKYGKIEAAAGGTLFLDEIGEMDPAIQARFLRVLQEREFERVGAVSPLRANIRLVAATNRNLAAEVQAGRFRSDLYYRINVIAIHVPPLRERRADIPLLAAHFLAQVARSGPRRIDGISPQARRRLMAYDWPGNVRELQNAVERAAVFCSGAEILEEDLPESLFETGGPDAAPEVGYYASLREAKRRILLEALAEADGVQQEAARRLGLNASHFSRLVRALGLKPPKGAS